MALDEISPPALTALDQLVLEATRQLNICNSCRFCEGYCAVFPALERRTLLSGGDVSQSANLCHDCRACFDACMYVPPHEFDLNLPVILSKARLESYRRYVWPTNVPRLFHGWSGVLIGVLGSTAIMLGAALAFSGPAKLIARPPHGGSPYELIPYPALLVLLLAPGLFSLVMFLLGGRRYWIDTGGSVPAANKRRAIGRAVVDSLVLRNLRGGGADCYYPKPDVASPIRRHLHGLVAYGFGLCFLSTVAAGIQQDFLGSEPPYPILSVPVISGLVGGVMIVIGTSALLWLKARGSKMVSFAEMTIKDYGLLVALDFLAVSGIATFAFRQTAAFGILFVIHLAAIGVTFAAAPYSKFVHLIYRFLALVRDNLEAQSSHHAV
jgi:citrate/tricarballylate utilization protein